MAHLLLAEDRVQEFEHLSRVLAPDGHRCTRARNGAEALARWRAERHDLVILDMAGPSADEIQATQQLKAAAAEQQSYVPVLMVTEAGGAEHRLEAFDAGADDFLTKPIADLELRARVRNFLHIRSHQRATEEAYRRLCEAQSLRDELMQLVVHDLKNPLASISSNLEYVETRLHDDDRGNEALADCRDATARLLRMVTVLLDLKQLEEGSFQPRMERHNARALLDASRRGRAHEARLRDLVVEVEADSAFEVRIDADLINRVLDNLLDNALRYSPRAGLIRLAAGPGPLGARLSVFNSGPVIPEKDRERIFLKYERITNPSGTRGSNRGIGLYFCRTAVRSHGGDITIDDAGGTGARFLIDLPA